VISPFMSSYDVYADFQTGDADGALALIRQVWGRMAVPSDFYSGATYEALGANGLTQMPSRTLSHGWSSGATVALSKYVLGVRPTLPGFAQWLIRPQPGDLTWARGQVPTPHGPISVSWQRHGAADFTLDLTIPQGTSGTVGIPMAEGTLLVNGHAQTPPASSDGYRYLNDIVAGVYHIEATDHGVGTSALAPGNR
jgi:alpha-L-rhamnosidase